MERSFYCHYLSNFNYFFIFKFITDCRLHTQLYRRLPVFSCKAAFLVLRCKVPSPTFATSTAVSAKSYHLTVVLPHHSIPASIAVRLVSASISACLAPASIAAHYIKVSTVVLPATVYTTTRPVPAFSATNPIQSPVPTSSVPTTTAAPSRLYLQCQISVSAFTASILFGYSMRASCLCIHCQHTVCF